MTTRRSAHDGGPCARRGAALLLALLALSVATVACVGALRVATTDALGARGLADEAQAREIALGLEPALLDWLRRIDGAGGMDGEWRDVLGAVFEDDGLFVRVRAVDLSGRLHVAHVDSLVWAGLPDELARARAAVRRVVKEGRRRDDPPALLDEIAEAVRAASPSARIVTHPPAAGADTGGALPIARWITTRGSGALNVRTAPLPLLESALRGADPSSARAVLDARRAGEPVDPGAASRLARARPPGGVPLTARSDACAFVVEVGPRGGERRWRLVAERAPGSAGSGPGRVAGARASGGAWAIVERGRIAP